MHSISFKPIFTRVSFFTRPLAWLGILLLPSMASAKVDLKPAWGGKSVSKQTDNATFMLDLTRNASAMERRAFEERLMDPGKARELRQTYEQIEARREFRERHSLSPMAERDLPQKQEEERRELTRNIVLTVGRYQGSRTLRQLKQATENDPYIRVMRSPVAIAAGAYALYTGEPFNFALSDSTRLKGHTKVAEKEGLLSMESSIVNASAEMKGNLGPTPTPRPIAMGDPEQYRFSLSRGIPVLDISSGLSYGTTTRSVGASVTKPLSAHLKCTVDTLRPVGNSQYTDNRVRFDYGVSF